MDKQYYIDNHIGVFKNFMPDYLINVKHKEPVILEKKMKHLFLIVQ